MRESPYSKAPSIMPKKAYAKQNNSKMIKNALQNVSLPGEMGRREREEVIAVIDANPTSFVVLFKGVLGRTDYRALYRQDYSEQDQDGYITKVHGAPGAPATITANMVDKFYKYNSGGKNFAQLGQQRNFTTTTDGISLKKEH